jgi:Fe-S cluster biogenesis protein NfuA
MLVNKESIMVNISAQITPNPHTLKFVVDRMLLEYGSIDFSNREKAATSPLVLKLYGIDGVTAIMVGTNFVSVTKSNSVDWTNLAEPVISILQKELDSGETGVDVALLTASTTSEGGSDIEARIREILDNEIRPAVAMDGGDITFHSYEDGIVMLRLQGACSSCPSSTLTLKMGIENRLREEIPEIRDVVQI